MSNQPGAVHGGDVEFIVTMQPGDNYRIAVARNQEGLNGLQVQNSVNTGYVKPGDEQPAGFNGVISPMLTVWRKLYLEVDSMTAVPDTGDQKNYEEGTIEAVTTQNGDTGPQSTIRLSIRLTGQTDRYEWGHIDIAEVGSFEVLTNTGNWISHDDVVVKGAPGSTAVGKTFKIYDDDDKYLTPLGLPAPLPRNDQHAAVINGMQEKYAAAYIQIEDATALGWNSRQTIDFKLNEPVSGFLGLSVFDDAKDLRDRPTKRDFWAHTLVFGYQPETASDHDPSANEDLESGGTPKNREELWSYGYSVVFIESIRESEIGSSFTPVALSNPVIAKDFRDKYRMRLLGVCAHEIGHSPGGHTEQSDHAEGGIMQEAASTIKDDFTPASILRFRRAWTWSYQAGGR